MDLALTWPGGIMKKGSRALKYIRSILHIFNSSISYQHEILNEQFSAIDKKTYFTIKATGMNIYPRYAAHILAHDEEILKNFHPKDIKQIMKAYLKDQELCLIDETQYKIESKTKRNGKFIFTVVSSGNLNYAKKMTSSEIINDKRILFSLSKNDIADVCIDAGMESVYFNFIDSRPQTESVCNVKKLFEIKN